jgi:SAM-dependent methyltransferase
VSGTWEAGAHEWAAHVRGGGDATYEWNGPAFFDHLLPPPAGLTIDVGCGEGRTTRELAARGYAVVGTDSAPTLVRLAREADPAREYLVADAADLPFGDGVAALVVAFMVLQDLDDLVGAVSEAGRVLDDGGRFCFAIVHPVATAGDFVAGEDDTFAVGSYCTQFEVERPLGRTSVLQFHRPLDVYSRALERSGFCIEAVREVATRRRAPGRVPAFLHLRAVKSG